MRVLFGATALLLLTGCVRHSQVQYFAATDPETGITHYYRMTITGTSVIAKYNMQAGYFSAAAVDVIRGQMPKIPTLDLPVDRLEVFDRLSDHLYASLIQTANLKWPINDADAASYIGGSPSKRSADRIAEIEGMIARLEKDKAVADADVAVKQAFAVLAKKKCDKAAGDLEKKANDISKPKNKGKGKLAKAKGKIEEAQRNLRETADAQKAAETELRRTQRTADAVAANLEALVKQRDRLNAIRITRPGRSPASQPAGDGPLPISYLVSESQIKDLARLIWYGSLSRSDLASIGMTGEASQYAFRKLVFWATARNLDLSQFATEIDGVIENVVSIAQAAKQQAKARKAAHKARRDARFAVLRGIEFNDPKQGLLMNNLIDLITGERAATEGDAP